MWLIRLKRCCDMYNSSDLDFRLFADILFLKWNSSDEYALFVWKVFFFLTLSWCQLWPFVSLGSQKLLMASIRLLWKQLQVCERLSARVTHIMSPLLFRVWKQLTASHRLFRETKRRQLTASGLSEITGRSLHQDTEQSEHCVNPRAQREGALSDSVSIRKCPEGCKLAHHTVLLWKTKLTETQSDPLLQSLLLSVTANLGQNNHLKSGFSPGWEDLREATESLSWYLFMGQRSSS